MANNYTQFSFGIDVSKDEEAWLVKHYEDDKPENNDELSECFDLGFIKEHHHTTASFGDCGGYADLEELIHFLKEFLHDNHRTDIISFEWADTCDRPKFNEFGGGAAVISSTGFATGSTSELVDHLSKKLADAIEENRGQREEAKD